MASMTAFGVAANLAQNSKKQTVTCTKKKSAKKHSKKTQRAQASAKKKTSSKKKSKCKKKVKTNKQTTSDAVHSNSTQTTQPNASSGNTGLTNSVNPSESSFSNSGSELPPAGSGDSSTQTVGAETTLSETTVSTATTTTEETTTEVTTETTSETDPDPEPEPDPEPSLPASANSTSEPHFADGVVSGTITASAISETSGIVASQQNPGVLWLHNDSGDSARVFAINTSGELLATYTVSGVTATDWEDISIGPGPTAGIDYLYIGDTGDNSASRSSGVKIYRVPEPSVAPDQEATTGTLLGAETLTVRYPGGARDSETLMVDPQSGDIYLLSKRTVHSEIYSYPYAASWGTSAVTLTYHGELTWNWAVSGEFSPDGDEIIVKSGSSVYMYDRPAGTDPATAMTGGTEWTLPYTLEPQGEAITFDADGLGYYTASEGSDQPLYYYERTE